MKMVSKLHAALGQYMMCMKVMKTILEAYFKNFASDLFSTKNQRMDLKPKQLRSFISKRNIPKNMKSIKLQKCG